MINYTKLTDIAKVIIAYVYYLFILNFLVIVGSCIGLLIFGLIPSIIALYACMLELFETNKINYPLSKFINVYKTYFVRSMLYSVVIGIIIFLLTKNISFIAYNISTLNSIPIMLITILSTAILSYALISIVIYAPILLVKFPANSNKEILLLAVTMIFMTPLCTIQIVFVTMMCLVLMSKIMMLIPIFGITLIAFNILILNENKNKITNLERSQNATSCI